MTFQQPPCPLHRVADVEQPPDQRLHPGQCPPLIRPAMSKRATLQLTLEPRYLGCRKLGRPGDPFDRTPSSPRSRHWRCQRSTDRSLTRSAAAISRFFAPLSK